MRQLTGIITQLKNNDNPERTRVAINKQTEERMIVQLNKHGGEPRSAV